MKRYRFFAIAVASMLAVACGDDNPQTQTIEVEAKCDLSSDCDCPDDYEAKCFGGQCQCRLTETIEVPSCEDKKDCDCPDDHETSCEDNQCICVLTQTETVHKPSCETAADCTTCDEGDKVSCEDSKCICTKTETETITAPSCETVDDCEGCAPGFEIACLDQKCYCSGEVQLPSCTQDSHCDCPDGQVASCEDNQCVCLATQPSCFDVSDCAACPQGTTASCLGQVCYCQGTIEVPIGCEKKEDCPCDTGYVPDCDNGMCYCTATVTETLLSCHDVSDCNCPPNYEAACVTNQCYCSYTQVVEAGCEGNSDCNCDPGYIPSCENGICYCDAEPINGDIVITVQDINWSYPVVIAGQSELLSVRYRVFGTSATNPLGLVQIWNQPGGEGTSAVPTSAIEQIWLSCSHPSGSGSYINTSATLVNGIAQFDSDCYDESGQGLVVQLAYDVAHFAQVGELLSGKEFRLVMEDLRIVDTQMYVPKSVVRKTMLDFAEVSAGSTLLTNGERPLYSFQVSAHANGSATLARLAFEVQKHDFNGGGTLALSNFQFLRGGTPISNVGIFDTNGTNLAGSNVLTGSEVIVSFENEEVIMAGTTQTYTLRAEVAGVQTGDKVTSYLRWGDDQEPITGKFGFGNANTAKLVGSDFSVGLFLSNSTYRTTPSHPNLNVIWSDRSASAHQYGTGINTSSDDFTNGYGFELEWLDAFEQEAI